MQTGVAVTIHGTIDSAASAPDSATVASVATTSSDLVDPVKILQPVATTTWALAAAFDRFVRWTRSSMEWQFKDTSHRGVPHVGLHPILEEMVALGAFPCNDQSLGMTATLEQGLLLQPLKVAGLVKDKEGANPRWFFTEQGALRLTTVVRISEPQQVFALRDEMALEQLTPYELIVSLADADWAWSAWVPPSKRGRLLADAFVPYVRDGPKVWYSGQTLAPNYMMVLLRADELFDRGLAIIEHGRHENSIRTTCRGTSGSLMTVTAFSRIWMRLIRVWNFQHRCLMELRAILQSGSWMTGLLVRSTTTLSPATRSYSDVPSPIMW